MPHSLYMDVHVSGPVTEGLRRRGIDVLTAQDDGQGRTADDRLLHRATALGRILFTQDDDLLAIANDWQANGTSFAGVIYCHQLRLGIGAQIDELELIAHCMDAGELPNRVYFLPIH